ncbi:hypothetical protein LXA43DRAFT_1063377 [Ganoderma leucocontextum]|nr:hypothetical protein LXA43DRAFT_1063377 [Ganoderma leucocontextum]
MDKTHPEKQICTRLHLQIPAPVPAPQIVQSGKVQEILEAIEKLTKHTVDIRMVVSSIEDVNTDVKNLLHNIKQLDKEIEIIKTELRVVSNDVANVADDLKCTKLEVAKVKDLVKHVDAQLEQERELRHMHQREEQGRSKLIANQLQTLIAVFAHPTPRQSESNEVVRWPNDKQAAQLAKGSAMHHKMGDIMFCRAQSMGRWDVIERD